jgi:peptidoglycan hydrolase CwlO-like protein
MKRFLTLVLALAILVSSAFVLSSCAKKPELDLEKAKEALEDADYVVRHDDDSDEPGYEENLYAMNGDDVVVIIKFTKSSTAKLYYDQLKAQMDASIKESKFDIKLAKHMIKTYEDDLKSDEIDDYEDEIKELEEELEEYEGYIIGRSGAYVWYGTEKAVEASKK